MPPYCELHQMYFRMAYVDGLPWKQCVCVKCQSSRLSGFDIAHSAFETTEILNEVKADKGLILTEEELKKNIDYLKRNRRGQVNDDVIMSLLEKIEKSHIELFRANASLSFDNISKRQVIDHQHLILDQYETKLNGG